MRRALFDPTDPGRRAWFVREAARASRERSALRLAELAGAATLAGFPDLGTMFGGLADLIRTPEPRPR